MDSAIESQRMIANALVIASLEFWVGVVICYLIQLVRFFRRGDTAFGVLCAVCLLLGGGGLVLGIPVALLLGWVRARQWGIRGFMTVFTALFLVALGNGVAAVVVLRVVTPEQWGQWFG